jgi:cysteine desulfurase / selenocysteine lyase
MNKDPIRCHFPILNRSAEQDHSLTYLDNAATTHKPQSVIDAICNFYKTANANVHRGLYGSAEQATVLYEKSRQAVANFIGAAHSAEIVFTKGTTESINLIAHSWGTQQLKAGDVILLSQAEHHANLLPWLELAKKIHLILRYIPYDQATHKLSLENLDLTGVKLLAVQHTSNVLGNVWDNDFANLATLIKQVHNVGGAVLLDIAQSIAHLPINVQALNVDFLAFSGHKMYGPTGIGVVYINKKWHDRLVPYHVGGSMIYSASYEGATWAAMPQLLEAGTPPISSVIGLHAAITFIQKNISFPELAKQEAELCTQFAAGLANLPGIRVVTKHDAATTHQHVASFYHEKIHAHDLASFLGEKNIAVRAGHHCAQPLIELLGVAALVRISVAAYTTPQDIELALQAIEAALNHLS